MYLYYISHSVIKLIWKVLNLSNKACYNTFAACAITSAQKKKTTLLIINSSSMFYNILEQIYTIMMENYQNYLE